MLFVTMLLFTAQATDPVAPPLAPVTTAAPKPKRICRDVDRPGSHMTSRVCHTETEWRVADARGADGDQAIPGNRVATGRAINTGAKGPTL